MPSRRITPAGQRSDDLPLVRAEWPVYEMDFYEREDGTSPARDWLRSLEFRKRFAAGHSMETQLQRDGVDVCRGRWGKNLGRGLAEFRVGNDDGQSEIVLRIFFHAFDDRRILILHGYDKGEDAGRKRQTTEIEEARRRLTDFQLRRKLRTYALRPLPPTSGVTAHTGGRRRS